MELAGLCVRQVVSGDGGGGCVKHGGSGKSQGYFFEHGSYLLLERGQFIVIIFSAVSPGGWIVGRWRGYLVVYNLALLAPKNVKNFSVARLEC